MSVQASLGATSDAAALDLGRGLPATAGLRPSRRPSARPPAARAQLHISQGTLALAGLLAMGLLISLSAAQTDLLLPQPLRPVLGTGLAGVFGHVRLDIGLGGIIAALALMFCSYGLALKAADQLSARAVLITILALNVLVLIAPPLFSTDIFSYIAYGREGVAYGVNPYLHGPSAILFDQVYPYVGSRWVDTPTAYGPLFTLLSYPLAGLSIAAEVFSYKAIAALSGFAVILLVWRAAKLRGVDPVKAVALVGLNPVLVVYGVGGGHNDLLMLALLVAAVYVLLTEHRRRSGALIIAATAVKLTAGIVLPFAIASSAGRRQGSDDRRQVLIGAGLSLLAVGAVAAALFGVGPLHLIGTLHTIQSGGGLHSVPGFILTVIGLARFAPAAGPGAGRRPARMAGLAGAQGPCRPPGLDHGSRLGDGRAAAHRRPAAALVRGLAAAAGGAERRQAPADRRDRPDRPRSDIAVAPNPSEYARRATRAYRAMRRRFGRRDGGYRRERPRTAIGRAHLWPFARAFVASLDLAGVPPDLTPFDADAELRLQLAALERYWDARSVPPAYASDPPGRDRGRSLLRRQRVGRSRARTASAHATGAGAGGPPRRARRLRPLRLGRRRPGPHPAGIFWVQQGRGAGRRNHDRNTVSTAPNARWRCTSPSWTRVAGAAGPDHPAGDVRVGQRRAGRRRGRRRLFWDKIRGDGTIDRAQWSYNQGSMVGSTCSSPATRAGRARLPRPRRADRGPGARPLRGRWL